MLDENLPTFYFAESSDGVKHHENFLLRRGGSDPAPAYSLRHADPSLQSSKNCYAVAVFDAFNPDVLYGEVLIRPKWTQPTLSAEEIRRHGGVAPPPEPIMPTDFTVQLYNPELQIHVTRETGMLGSQHYDFSMPQDTFRMPSGSMLDRVQDDPAASVTTPRINFSLKREGKLSKDMVLYVRGKSTDIFHKKKSKEPDIAISIYKGLREVTILESNLYRVEMEDSKGLEVVILLICTVIRDVFYGQISQAFNVSASAPRRTSGAKLSPTGRPAAVAAGAGAGAGAAAGYTMSGALNSNTAPPPSGPITDPRTQWELDAETQRLKRQQEDEARQQRREASSRRRERERADEEEARRIQRQLEEEESAARRQAADVDRETERLKKIYGSQQLPPRSQAHSAPIQQGPFAGPPQQPPQNSNLNTYPQFPQRPGQSPSYPPPQQQQQQQQQQGHSYPPPSQQQQQQQQQPPPQPYGQYNPSTYTSQPPPPQPSYPQQQGNPALPPRPNQSGGQSSLYPTAGGGFNALNAGASLGSWFSGRDRNKQKSSADLRRGSDGAGAKLTKRRSGVF